MLFHRICFFFYLCYVEIKGVNNRTYFLIQSDLVHLIKQRLGIPDKTNCYLKKTLILFIG